MIFVDTNYFLRFLLKDVDRQHQEAKQLFKDGAKGKIRLFTSLLVFFEIYWVLFSFYEQEKVRIIQILRDILKMGFVQLEERVSLKEALAIFAKSTLDLEDSFNLVYAQKMNATAFKTFDQKLKKKFKKI